MVYVHVRDDLASLGAEIVDGGLLCREMCISLTGCGAAKEVRGHTGHGVVLVVVLDTYLCVFGREREFVKNKDDGAPFPLAIGLRLPPARYAHERGHHVKRLGYPVGDPVDWWS